MLNAKRLKQELPLTPKHPIGFFDWISNDLGFFRKDVIKIIEDPRYAKILEILTIKYQSRKQKLTKTRHNKLTNNKSTI
jgi:hypothetical protein